MGPDAGGGVADLRPSTPDKPAPEPPPTPAFAQEIKEDQSAVLLEHIRFNQDHSCFSAGTTVDFRTFTVGPVAEAQRRQPKGPAHERGVRHVAMLYKTNMFALVPKANPHKVLIWNDSAKRAVGELPSRFEVKSMALRRDVLAVVSEYRVVLYSALQFNVLKQVETASNPRGVCALAPEARDQWLLVAPGMCVGQLRIQVAETEELIIFKAHETALACVTVDASGERIASASETGTVIKVWGARDGMLLHELRRGHTPVQVSCLCFRQDGVFLAVASSSPTVHLFRLDRGDESPSSLAKSGTNLALSLAQAVAPDSAGQALSKAVTSINQARSCAVFRIPDVEAGEPSVDLRTAQAKLSMVGPVVGFGPDRLYVLHYTGFVYECVVDDQAGTEGFQQCRFVGATTWFGSRADFQMHQERVQNEDDEWTLM